jgi:O-antigen ligase
MDTNLDAKSPGSTRAVLIQNISPFKITWIGISLFGLFLLAGIGLAFVAVHWSFKIALLLLVVIAGSLVVVKRPEIGLLMVVAAIPLEDFNSIGDLGSISLMKLLSIGVLGAYLIHHFFINPDEKFVYTPQNFFIVGLLFAVLVSYFVAVDPETAISQTYKLLRMVVFYFLIINIVRSQAILQRVIWVMVITGIFSAGYGLYEYYLSPAALIDNRVSGTLDDPMSFSYSIVILLPLVWYLITRNQKVIARLLLLAVAAQFSYAIILSGTRSGILAAIGALVWIALRQKRTIVINTAVIVVFFFLGLVFMPDTIKTRLGLTTEADKGAQSSTERRLTYATFGVELFLQNPIIGLGLGGFRHAYSHSEYQYFRTADDVDRIAHNMYMELATGAGLLGLVPFVLIMVTPIYRLQISINKLRSGHLAELAKMVQVSLVAFLFIGFFASSQYDKPLWLIIGLATAIPEIVKHELQKEEDLLQEQSQVSL